MSKAGEFDAVLVEEHSRRCGVTPMPSSSSLAHKLGAVAAARIGQSAGRYNVRANARRYVDGGPRELREGSSGNENYVDRGRTKNFEKLKSEFLACGHMRREICKFQAYI